MGLPLTRRCQLCVSPPSSFGQGENFFGFQANVNVEFFVSGLQMFGKFFDISPFFASARPAAPVSSVIAHTEVGAEHTDTPPAGRPPLPYTTTTLRTTLLTPTNTPNALLYLADTSVFYRITLVCPMRCASGGWVGQKGDDGGRAAREQAAQPTVRLL